MTPTLRGSMCVLALAAAVLLVATPTNAQGDTFQDPRETREALQQLLQDYVTMTPGRADIAARVDRLSRALAELRGAELDALHRAMAASPTLRPTMERIHASVTEPTLEFEAAVTPTRAVDPEY